MVASKPAKAVKKAVKATVESAAARVAERLAELETPPVPGTPGSGTPKVAEPTKPRDPLPPKPDQAARSAVRRRARPTDVDAEEVSGAGPVPDHGPGRPAARHRPLAQGGRARADAAAGPPPAREDHPLRPRADPGARRARPRRRRPRHVHRLRQRPVGDEGRASSPRTSRPGVRAVLDRARVARVGRHGAGHPRVRDEVLHRRGQLRPGRQQHPGLLHPGRHQVPRRHPRRQAAPGPGDPAGAERPRHLLGLRVAAHRGAAPHDLEHVRPRHPALVPDDGGLRRPHLPVREHRRGDLAGEVPLEAACWACTR